MTRVDYYRIDLKKIPRKYRSSEPLQVTRSSALKLREQVEQFAIYFMREFDYAVQEFDAKEKDPYTAYLLPDSADRHARVWIGACCFRPESYVHYVHDDTLRWIWLHPYHRMKGISQRFGHSYVPITVISSSSHHYLLGCCISYCCTIRIRDFSRIMKNWLRESSAALERGLKSGNT